MGNILYLVHRLPYPPNKGDKVRSYHLLRHLTERHRVFLGTFMDAPEDEEYIDILKSLCVDVYVEKIHPGLAKIKSLLALPQHQALTLAYYRSGGLSAWIDAVVRHHGIDACVIFSSAMAIHAKAVTLDTPLVVDFVDVDSFKWQQYAGMHSWPLSWIYQREARLLFEFERNLALNACHSFFVTKAESDLFLRLAPECAAKVNVMSNGVDADFFAPDVALVSPFPSGQLALVFTGAMDYWPNVDAVIWFAVNVLPKLKKRWPNIHFYVVGRNPTKKVIDLSSVDITVTGTVADVRPFLQYATMAVAPLRVARGIQNKILEAMAMGRAVITTPQCADAIGADVEQGLLRAENATEYEEILQSALMRPSYFNHLGSVARKYVLENYSCEAHLQMIDRFLPA